MKRSTAHLPERKRQELKRIAETIVEEVPSAQMVILFGSHARGDWVELFCISSKVKTSSVLNFSAAGRSVIFPKS